MSTMGSERVSKRDWYRNGGFANSRCWRRQRRNGAWEYYYMWGAR